MRAGEGGNERVTLALLDWTNTVVAVHRGVHDLVQAHDRGLHLARVVFPGAGGALDVREQERDRAGREQQVPLGHRCIPSSAADEDTAARTVLLIGAMPRRPRGALRRPRTSAGPTSRASGRG